MFETVKFEFHSAKMRGIAKAAAKAKKAGNNQQALLLLRKALEAGHAALSIQGPKISEQQRSAIANIISSGQKLCQRELIAQMPEDDRELLVSVLKSWTDMGIVTIGAHPIDQMIGMFDIAKRRLGTGKEVLGIIYKGDHVPAPLRNIMQPFLAEEVTQEETEKRLDECTAKLRKWMPELFPGEPLHAR